MSELENCSDEDHYETYWIDDESPIKNDIVKNRRNYRIRKTENEKDDIIKKVD